MNSISGIPIQTSPIQPLQQGNLGQVVQQGGQGQGPEFADFLLESLGQVNAMQQDADRAVEKMMTGGEVNTAEVLTAVQKADMSFRLMMQVRNKLVSAYQEIKDIRI